jgi:imidazolonepropionase-like amidohydrolase
MTASTLPEALAHVRYAKEHGFTGIKIYGSIRPEWVRPMAREAHRLGLHVSGHIPAGMRPREAVRAGYDEITHINFVFMQAMPDAVVRDSNGMKRFYGPAEFAADVDLARTPMRPFLDELARRRTVVDTTVVAFEGLLTTNPGEPHPGIAPFLGALPPQAERWARAGGAAPPPNVSRERMRASFARMRDSIAELHRRDITILAGTDGTGLELVRELELYVQAGLTPAEALANATIVPARVFGLADRTGSIAAGKLAELALIDGDPSSQIGDLRHVAYVMRDGRLMEAQALRAALGLGAPPPN